MSEEFPSISVKSNSAEEDDSGKSMIERPTSESSILPPSSHIMVISNKDSLSLASNHRLRLNPNKEHQSENYENMEGLGFPPYIFSYLEKYLPPSVLESTRDEKTKFMKSVIFKYLPLGDRIRAHRHKDYKFKIMSDYQPLHKWLQTMHPGTFFVPSFVKAINEGTEESLRAVISEPCPGIFTFEIFQPRFCELIMSEVENFDKWVKNAKFSPMQPNIMNKHGAILDDFGLEIMLRKIMDCFVSPMSKVFFPEFGGASLDSHHGFVVEYGEDKDVDIGFHVDDSEVTLNVCLGKQFSGGELYFRGKRCDAHVNSITQSEEIYDYCHMPGRAVLHVGRHRHGARATISGHRLNLIIWCRSSDYREMKKYQKDCSNWCGECSREKDHRHRASIDAMKKELLQISDACKID